METDELFESQVIALTEKMMEWWFDVWSSLGIAYDKRNLMHKYEEFESLVRPRHVRSHGPRSVRRIPRLSRDLARGH